MRALLCLLILGCEPAMPDILELECAMATYDYFDPGSDCVRLDASEGALVRALGSDGCDTWAACVTLQPGELAETGNVPPTEGLVQITRWECSKMPACNSGWALP